MIYVQAAPYSIQIGPVRGCNLSCSFCAVSSFKKAGDMKGYEFMSLDTAERIASEISRMGWNSRLEFAMHGEPSFHPELETLITMFREYLPNNQIMLLSNGAKFLPDPTRKMLALFEAGVDVMCFDNYENVKLVPKILERMDDMTPVPMFFYPKDKGLRMANPHANLGRKKRIIVIADPSRAVTGNHSTLNSHGGAVDNGGDPENFREKRCHKVFREMVFYQDGSVNACCQDWEGRMILGSIHTSGIGEIWNGAKMQVIRKALYHGRDWSDLPACRACDMPGNRTGLLPDKYGKESLPLPTVEELSTLPQEPRYPLPKR